ncbi:L,D-transpeptidase [Rhizobium sp. S-51]|uniref:L,D-transpeptidase n=1 Tax=Rhizobium terricola TaxID=2728849 RepID=A0A7Y0AWC2_9HYPH|nr:L,D-transpeptidase [Rhizobium terricola]NML74688.1 L,D-transpeptidase [Rhizobium terricola]
MFQKSVVLAALVGLSVVAPAQANDRYQARPPVIVSPDLSAPWVMQLGGAVRPVVYAPRAAQPRTYQRQILRRTPQQPALVQPAAVRPNAPMKTRLDPMFLPQTVAYDTPHKPGTIVIDTNNRFLYLVAGNGQARRYGVGVGKPGFEWAGKHKITAKKEWPDWTPPQEMIAREAAKGHYLPARMDGGPENPLGARAMYLGSTLYRIHGTNAPWTIGNGVSSGCIRMRNEDVVDLYERVKVGTTVIVM